MSIIEIKPRAISADRSSPEPQQASLAKFVDYSDEHEGHWFLCMQTIVSAKTAFQQVDIIALSDFGKALVIDGAIQSVEDDEYIYHEALVQPAMCLHPDPRRVLIIGGGEGATAREALRHPGVEQVVMIDLDPKVVDLCREHLQTWHMGAFDDPRFRLVIEDGVEFVRETKERFDVVILDVVDSFDGGPAEALYTPEFYRMLKTRLNQGGIVAIQGMECNVNEWEDHAELRRNLMAAFAHVRTYTTFVPSFWCDWGYVLASDQVDPLNVTAQDVDTVIAARRLASKLEFYDGLGHHRMFSIPKDLRALLRINR